MSASAELWVSRLALARGTLSRSVLMFLCLCLVDFSGQVVAWLLLACVCFGSCCRSDCCWLSNWQGFQVMHKALSLVHSSFCCFLFFFLIFFCKNHPRELQPRPLSPQTLFQSSCVPLIEWRYQPKVMSSLQVELLEKMGVCFVLLFTKLNKAAAHFSLILWIRLWTPGGNGCQLQCVTQGRMNLHVPSGLANLAWRAESFSQHLVQWCGLVRFSSAATCFIHCALFPAAQILLLMQLAGALFFIRECTVVSAGTKGTCRECLKKEWNEMKLWLPAGSACLTAGPGVNTKGSVCLGQVSHSGTQAGILRHP